MRYANLYNWILILLVKTTKKYSETNKHLPVSLAAFLFGAELSPNTRPR